MMEKVVIDASFLMSIFLDDEKVISGYEDIETKLLNGKFELFAPPILMFELNNVLLVAVKRKRLKIRGALSILREIELLGIQVVNVDQTLMFRLAQRIGLTAYDASYVWLARKMGVELLTHDKKMFRGRTS